MLPRNYFISFTYFDDSLRFFLRFN